LFCTARVQFLGNVQTHGHAALCGLVADNQLSSVPRIGNTSPTKVGSAISEFS